MFPISAVTAFTAVARDDSEICHQAMSATNRSATIAAILLRFNFGRVLPAPLFCDDKLNTAPFPQTSITGTSLSN